MLFERQKHLLALTEALGGEIGNLDYQKMLLLYCCELAPTPPYDFVPYRYGAFSFTSYADKRRLIKRGLLADEERLWKLTSAGREVTQVSPTLRVNLTSFVRQYADFRGEALVAETYRRYPYYAIRSEIASKVLAGDTPALRAIDAAKPDASHPGLCTIGYEGHTLESYLNRLIRDGVSLLCDVRRNPLSRKYGFSKSTLAKACEGIGLCYQHRPQLGIASEDRQGLDTQTDYDVLFAAYRRNCLPQQHETLREIGEWIEAGQRVALTCYEKLPEQCHRHCVADLLEQIYGRVCKPRHL